MEIGNASQDEITFASFRSFASVKRSASSFAGDEFVCQFFVLSPAAASAAILRE
jgi:hypothetical protein